MDEHTAKLKSANIKSLILLRIGPPARNAMRTRLRTIMGVVFTFRLRPRVIVKLEAEGGHHVAVSILLESGYANTSAIIK
jgi:hypothetical protein